MSRALRGMEEIDPRAFNNGAEDSGLPISHTYVNDGSNSKLYPSSKKTRKSLSNLDAKHPLFLIELQTNMPSCGDENSLGGTRGSPSSI
ncbi:hypothetical protein RGQ29_013797 [Quercus rubra]|uniref:Uncharacterized protein n=1 Tax=Quercus rubra TaxID=3512 RepID=A0AAN7FM79_QUERU|nr:hypothetical protein RGQ29_013797 [Quercus rubra]